MPTGPNSGEIFDQINRRSDEDTLDTVFVYPSTQQPSGPSLGFAPGGFVFTPEPPVRAPAPVPPLLGTIGRVIGTALRPLIALLVPGPTGPPGTGEHDWDLMPALPLPPDMRVPDVVVADPAPQLDVMPEFRVVGQRPPPPPPRGADVGNDPIMPPNWWDLINEPWLRDRPGFPLVPIPLPVVGDPVPGLADDPSSAPGQPGLNPKPALPFQLEPFGDPAPAPTRPAPGVRPTPRTIPLPGLDPDPVSEPAPQPSPRPTPAPAPGPGASPFPWLNPFPDYFTDPLSRPPSRPPTRDPPRNPIRVPTSTPVPDLTAVPWDQPRDDKADPCNCTKTKKKKPKKKQEREICTRGTYRQLKKGIVYRPKERVNCADGAPLTEKQKEGEVFRKWKEIQDRMSGRERPIPEPFSF